MNTVEVRHIAKSFGDIAAVKDVNFEIKSGEIFGLLGPNGAGKTTTIRMMLDIFRPDKGEIEILGGKMDADKKERIGYMPEERGLYQEIALEPCLLYLAVLKGMPAAAAKPRLAELLERFDLDHVKKQKVKSLSKGMQQKAQIISTILHEPELIIIDEPFTSLDPVNTRLVKSVIRELRDDGCTMLMSTHQMHQVEELCDRILLIDHGTNLLYGELKEIQQRFTGHELLVTAPTELPPLPGVIRTESHNQAVKLYLEPQVTPQAIMRSLLEREVAVDSFQVARPSLEDIFVQVVEAEDES